MSTFKFPIECLKISACDKNTRMYYNLSTRMYYDRSTRMYYDRSTRMYYNLSARTYYDKSTQMYYNIEVPGCIIPFLKTVIVHVIVASKHLLIVAECSQHAILFSLFRILQHNAYDLNATTKITEICFSNCDSTIRHEYTQIFTPN